MNIMILDTKIYIYDILYLLYIPQILFQYVS